MTCRLITPDSGHHQAHMGRVIAEGTFADDQHPDVPGSSFTRICIHPDAEGLSPAVAVAVVRKDSLTNAAKGGSEPVKEPKPIQDPGAVAKPKRVKKAR